MDQKVFENSSSFSVFSSGLGSCRWILYFEGKKVQKNFLFNSFFSSNTKPNLNASSEMMMGKELRTKLTFLNREDYQKDEIIFSISATFAEIIAEKLDVYLKNLFLKKSYILTDEITSVTKKSNTTLHCKFKLTARKSFRRNVGVH